MTNEINSINNNSNNQEGNNTMTTKSISIVNLKNANNNNVVNAIRAKFGANIDNLNIFPYQSNTAPVQFKFHKDNKRLFVEYPAFNAVVTPDYANIYLKRDGEGFPSICYKVSKKNVESVLTNDVLNNYINTPVTDIATFLESSLTNETRAVMDNLEITVLVRILEKEKTEGKKEYSYANLFDLIRSKMAESKDIGYLEKLNKTCVMMWETYSNPTNLSFKAIELFAKTEKVVKTATTKTPKAPKAVKNTVVEKAKAEKVKKEAVKTAIKESTVISEFKNPEEVPVLENINDGSENQRVEINEELVAGIIDSI